LLGEGTISVPLSEPRRPALMVSPSFSTLLGSPRRQWSNFSPRSAAHCHSLTVPFPATLSSSPVMSSEIEPRFGLPPFAARYSAAAATKQGRPPFLSAGAAP